MLFLCLIYWLDVQKKTMCTVYSPWSEKSLLRQTLQHTWRNHKLLRRIGTMTSGGHATARTLCRHAIISLLQWYNTYPYVSNRTWHKGKTGKSLAYYHDLVGNKLTGDFTKECQDFNLYKPVHIIKTQDDCWLWMHSLTFILHQIPVWVLGWEDKYSTAEQWRGKKRAKWSEMRVDIFLPRWNAEQLRRPRLRTQCWVLHQSVCASG